MWLETHKPTASCSAHLIMAAAMWTIVGMVLLGTGAWWLVAEQNVLSFLLIPLAVAIGIVKSWLVLDSIAEQIAGRIKIRGDDYCIGGFLSVKNWIIVIVMIIMGRILRSIHLPRILLGMLYSAIGTGLLFSSRFIWQDFVRQIWKRGES